MERVWKKSIINLIIWLSLANVAFAGDSLTLSVSCTIPAIPGLNAPLIEEETIKTEEHTPEQPKSESQKEAQPQLPPLIEQDNQQEKIISEGQKKQIIVKTIYSR